LISSSGSFTVGDKTFSNFFFNGPAADPCLGLSGCTWSPSTAAQISVISLDDLPLGIRFSAPFQLNNVTAGNATAVANFTFGYRVTSSGGAINGIYQGMPGAGAAGNGSQVLLIETAADPGTNNIVANSSLSFTPTDFSDPGVEPGDNLFITPPLQSINVLKDLTLTAVGGGFAKVSAIDQRFTQVPEPGFYGLISLGVGTLLFLRRRKTAA
jgi:hypothetical protein